MQHPSPPRKDPDMRGLDFSAFQADLGRVAAPLCDSVASPVKRGWDFPGGSVVKNPPSNTGDTGDTSSGPGLGRCPEEGNGNLRQYSCLGNPMDRGD